MTPTTLAGLTGLKGALSYVRAYRDKTFVVKLGGEVLADQRALDNLATQLALLSSLGIRIVVVHGGGPQISRLQRRLGQEPQMIAGRRITDDAALEAATMVFAGQVSTQVCSALRQHGVAAVGLTGVDAELITASRRPPTMVRDDQGQERLVDFGHVGDVSTVDPRLLEHLVAARFVPVVGSLAGDHQGRVFNVNADTVAQVLATALCAEKLVFLTGAPGVLRQRDDPATLISFADADDLQPLLADGSISGGMRPKVDACLRAVASGVVRTHVIDGRTPDALLLEVFTGSGVGTMIVLRKGKLDGDDHAA